MAARLAEDQSVAGLWSVPGVRAGGCRVSGVNVSWFVPEPFSVPSGSGGGVVSEEGVVVGRSGWGSLMVDASRSNSSVPGISMTVTGGRANELSPA